FDAARNTLAALTSSTQRSARLDRVFVRDGAFSLRPAAAELFATAPIDRTAPPLFPSDHFGLAVRARIGALDPTPPAAARETAPPPRRGRPRAPGGPPARRRARSGESRRPTGRGCPSRPRRCGRRSRRSASATTATRIAGCPT